MSFTHLFTEGRIGSVAIPNRVVVAPMTRISAAPGGLATDEMARYYAEYGRGGFGLVITEATYIDETHSQSYVDQPGLANDAQGRSWQPVVAAVRPTGARIFAQLVHAGALVQHNDYARETVAPSAVQPLGEQPSRYRGSGPFPMPREITRQEMRMVVASFAAAASRAAEAGFDGVEIHGANGYLIDQFLTTYTNKRADEYGGPTENRVRFAAEVVRAVRDAVPRELPIGIRISQTKLNDRSHSWEGGARDAEIIFPALAAAGADFIHVSAHLGCNPVFGGELSLAGLAKRSTGLTIIANGKLEDADRAEQVLAAGEADFVSIGKGALADPHWPEKVARGEAPIPFDPGMIAPVATIANTRQWRERHPQSAQGH